MEIALTQNFKADNKEYKKKKTKKKKQEASVCVLYPFCASILQLEWRDGNTAFSSSIKTEKRA